ncbi:MAG: ABC transporter permease [Bdellovibrionales bacterium]|nr:ABC transporter permease [Bdellovibrionales bacterium]
MLNKLFTHLIRSWKHHLGVQMTTLFVLSGVFSVLMGFFVVYENIDRILTQWGDKVQLSVYLNDEITETDKTKIEGFITDTSKFSGHQFVSKNQAAENFKQQMQGYAPDLMEDEEFGNPLPSSFEVTVKSGLSVDDQIELLVSSAKSLLGFKGVSDVSYGQSWVENYASIVQGFSASAVGLIIVLIVGSILVIGNSMRHAVSQRQREIEVMELVGATSWSLRRPYIFEGAVMAVLAGGLGMIISYFVIQWQSGLIQKELGFVGFGSGFQFIGFGNICLFLLIAAGLGAIASYVSVRNINTGWTARKEGRS